MYLCMIKLLKRYLVLDQMFPTDKDYEYTVKRSLQMNNIETSITNMFFFKIRNDKDISRQGIMRTPYFNNIYTYVKSII